MRNSTAIVTGSGASRGSGYLVSTYQHSKGSINEKKIAPPTDQEFFDVIQDAWIKNSFPALWYFKNVYYSENQKKSMENIWTDIDINHKHITLNTYDWFYENEDYINNYRSMYPLSDIEDKRFIKSGFLELSAVDTNSPIANKYKLLGDCGRDFRRLIYKIYAEYSKPTGVDHYKQLYELFVESKYAISSYITFNYDCYIEDSLIEVPLKYVGANDRTDSYESLTYGGIPIIKLHGSLNWEYKHDDIDENVTYRAFPYSSKSQVFPKYESDKKWIEPTIIPPTIFKKEINDDSRFDHPLTKTILQQWRAAITLFVEADLIIIIGYSFPMSDHHVARIFRISNMIRRRKGFRNNEILYCCGSHDDGDEMKFKIKNIIGSEIDPIIVKGFENLAGSSELNRIIK